MDTFKPPSRVPSIRFRYDTPATEWVCEHNQGKYPEAVTLDSSGTRVYGTVIYDNANKLRVQFSVPFSGTLDI
jgi:hypothetical protein